MKSLKSSRQNGGYQFIVHRINQEKRSSFSYFVSVLGLEYFDQNVSYSVAFLVIQLTTIQCHRLDVSCVYTSKTYDIRLLCKRLPPELKDFLSSFESSSYTISSETELTNVLAKCKSTISLNDECDLNSFIEDAHALLD